ncbi:MAG: hypothetical protein N2A97_04510 [Thermodesulfobacteriales bacterium]
MRLNFAYPSVSVFPQSSILLQKWEGRDSTPTETALGAFLIVAAQPLKAPGAQLRIERESSTRLGRLDKNFMGAGSTCNVNGRWDADRVRSRLMGSAVIKTGRVESPL